MENSLFVLEELINKRRNKKTKRLTNLIADFSQGYARNWHFCVPFFFHESLDIKFTERILEGQKSKLWTQESSFNFAVGDTFYNHSYAYCNNFKCLSKVKLCIQIESVLPCIPQFMEKPRNPGLVIFKLYEVKDCMNFREHHSLSQDDFLELLIAGLDILKA